MPTTKKTYSRLCVLVAAVFALSLAVSTQAESSNNAPSGAKAVSAGGTHTCAIRDDGTLACWGDDSSGQLDGIPDGTFQAVSAGGTHTCAIRDDGTLACWGDDSSGQLDGIPDGTFQAVSAGGTHTCAIRDDGTLACWGDDSSGQLDGIPDGTFQAVSAGGTHTCAIRTSEHLACWGGDSDGQVSDAPTGYYHHWWHHHHHLPEYQAVSAGGTHTCAIRDDGTLACWGDDSSGQLDGIPDGTFQAVSAGGTHTCAIRDDGTLACWGDDSSGQLDGIPDGTFQAVSAGGTHTCAIRDDGTLACWNSNDYGQSQPRLITSNLSPAVTGMSYLYRFETTPQNPGPQFYVSSGQLPNGLTLSGDGTLSGVATTVGSYTFTVVSVNGVTEDAEWQVTLDVQDAPPQPDTGLPPPIAGKTFNIEPVKGQVKVRCRHRRLHKLKAPEQVPISCVIDASDGTVGLTTSKGGGGGTQSGHFWGSVFGVHQRARHRNTVLTLIGKLECARKKKKPEAGKVDSDGDHDGDRVFLRKRKRRGRKLWGSGKGNFKTVGNYGSASVRGTIWLVEDRCDGSTFFKVRRGTVWVRDFVRRRLVVLHAGRHYVAKKPGSRRHR